LLQVFKHKISQKIFENFDKEKGEKTLNLAILSENYFTVFICGANVKRIVLNKCLFKYTRENTVEDILGRESKEEKEKREKKEKDEGKEDVFRELPPISLWNKGVSCLSFGGWPVSIAAGNDEGMICVRDCDTEQKLQFSLICPAGVSSLDYHPTKNKFVAGCLNGEVVVFDLDKGASSLMTEQVLSVVRSLAFHPSGQAILLGGGVLYENGVAILNLDNSLRQKPVQDNLPQVTCVAISQDGKMMAVGSMHGEILVSEFKTGKTLWKTYEAETWIESLAFSPDSTQIAAATRKNEVLLFQAHDGKNRHCLLGPRSFVMSVNFSPDGVWLACASLDGHVYIWRLNDLNNPKRIKPKLSNYPSFVPRPTGKVGLLSLAFNRAYPGCMAVGSTQGSIALWTVKYQPNQPGVG
jgi:WD40 repeat protein